MSVMVVDYDSYDNLVEYLIENKQRFDVVLPLPEIKGRASNRGNKIRFFRERIRLLQLLNHRSYYHGYKHRDDVQPEKPFFYPGQRKAEKALTHIEAYKTLEAILYNCDIGHDSRYIKEWKEWHTRLSKFIITETDEYKAALWG